MSVHFQPTGPLPVAIDGVSASIAASAMHPSTSLLGQSLLKPCLLTIFAFSVNGADLEVVSLREWQAKQSPSVVVAVEFIPGESAVSVMIMNGLPETLLLNDERNVAYLIDQSGNSIAADGSIPLHSKNALDCRRSFREVFPGHVNVPLDSVTRRIQLPKDHQALRVAVNVSGYRVSTLEYFDQIYVTKIAPGMPAQQLKESSSEIPAP